MSTLKAWSQIFRWQTAPADICLVLTPYLMGGADPAVAVLLGLYVWFLHGFTFGHNSLMDTAMGYDKGDPSKGHHPLVSGAVSLGKAHNVIHWGLLLLTLPGVALSLRAANPTLALICLLVYLMAGHAYNDGLSKESLFGFLPISECFASLGAWGYFMSHVELSGLGFALVLYYFLAIVFQIAYEGHLKEVRVGERGNILVRLGARVVPGIFTPEGYFDIFDPGRAGAFGVMLKVFSLGLGACLLGMNFSVARLVWYGAVLLISVKLLWDLTKFRKWDRDKELMRMSLMEIATIYLPMPLVLGWVEAGALMIFGVMYFFVMNKVLWGVSYPRV